MACAAAESCSPPGAVCAEEAQTDTGTATTAGAAKHDDGSAPAVVDEELSDEEEDWFSGWQYVSPETIALELGIVEEMEKRFNERHVKQVTQRVAL